MEMQIKSQVQFNDDLSQRSNIVSGDSLSNSFAKIHHDLNDYEIAANIAANDRPKNLLYIHDILSDSVSTATEEILGYPLEAGTYVYSAEIYTVQNPSVANVTKIEFLGADGNTVVGTCNIACDTKKEEHINVTLSDEAYYIKYYRDTYSSETVGYLKTSKQMICLPNVYAAFPEYTMYSPSLGETFLEVEDSVKTYDVQDTYNSSSYKAISGKGVAAALETLDVSSVGGSGKYISAISEADGKIEATATTFDTALSSSSTNSNAPTSKTVYDDQQRQEAEIGAVANVGAKNLFDVRKATFGDISKISISVDDTVTSTVTSDPRLWEWANREFEFTLPAGTYIFKYSVVSGTVSNVLRFRLMSQTDDQFAVLTNTTNSVTFTLTSNTTLGFMGKPYALSFKLQIQNAVITDPTFQPYALPNPTLTPAAIKAVDEGAKNLAEIRTPTPSWATVTKNVDGSLTFNIPTALTYNEKIIIAVIHGFSGDFVVSGCTGGSSTTYRIAMYNDSFGTTQLISQYNDPVPYSGDTTGMSLGVRVMAGYSGTFTIKPMICTAADWAVSHKFVPYCPSMAEMYEKQPVLKQITYSATSTDYEKIDALTVNIPPASTMKFDISTIFNNCPARGIILSSANDASSITDGSIFAKIESADNIGSLNTSALVRNSSSSNSKPMYVYAKFRDTNKNNWVSCVTQLL